MTETTAVAEVTLNDITLRVCSDHAIEVSHNAPHLDLMIIKPDGDGYLTECDLCGDGLGVVIIERP